MCECGKVEAKASAGVQTITPAMIEAGAYAAREHPLGGKLEDLVWAVFLAMDTERYNNDSASATNPAK